MLSLSGRSVFFVRTQYCSDVMARRSAPSRAASRKERDFGVSKIQVAALLLAFYCSEATFAIQTGNVAFSRSGYTQYQTPIHTPICSPPNEPITSQVTRQGSCGSGQFHSRLHWANSCLPCLDSGSSWEIVLCARSVCTTAAVLLVAARARIANLSAPLRQRPEDENPECKASSLSNVRYVLKGQREGRGWVGGGRVGTYRVIDI